MARLELAGFGRIEMEMFVRFDHSEALRAANFRETDTQASWDRNRRRSDESIGKYGIPRSPRFPGRCEWIEIDSQCDGTARSRPNRTGNYLLRPDCLPASRSLRRSPQYTSSGVQSVGSRVKWGYWRSNTLNAPVSDACRMTMVKLVIT